MGERRGRLDRLAVLSAPRRLLCATALAFALSAAATSGQGLPPPLDQLPPLPFIPAPADPPAETPGDVADGAQVPDACSGGVLSRGGRLQRFADSLAPGETGCLRRGVYKGGVDLRRPRTALRSYPGEKVTLKGGQVRISPDATAASISGMRLVSTQLSPLIYASRAVISHNTITNHHTNICVHVARYPGTPIPNGVVIENNRIHDCGPLPPDNHDHGVYIAVGRNTVIRHNLIYDNADRGVQLYPIAMRTRVVGNVIDGNGEGIIFGGRTNHSLVKDNIISNSTVRHNVEATAPKGNHNVVRDNCLWSERADEYYRGDPPNSGVLPGHPGFKLGPNVIADPQFDNRIGFHPAAGSPCAGFGPG